MSRRVSILLPLSTLILFTTLFAMAQSAGPAASAAQGVESDGQHNFDFLIGKWKIHNRRLTKPLSGSREWQEFEGASVARQIWDGRANMDEFQADSPAGHIEGMTVRLYNPRSHQWSLYWATSKNGMFALPPTVGEFKNGRGEFFDDEEFSGRPIRVRYLWSGIAPDSCRWEQAFSVDGGKIWETNWIMTLTRVKEE